MFQTKGELKNDSSFLFLSYISLSYTILITIVFPVKTGVWVIPHEAEWFSTRMKN